MGWDNIKLVDRLMDDGLSRKIWQEICEEAGIIFDGVPLVGHLPKAEGVA